MSRPQNPLSFYRSSSYFHVLVMCSDTGTAELLASLPAASDRAPWLHPTIEEINASGYPELGRYAPKQLQVPNSVLSNAKAAGKYCVIVNGSTDADFVITSVKFSSISAGDVVSTDRGTSIAYEGSIRISEPRGTALMDVFVLASKSLGIDATSAVFMIKTFFIGFTDDLSSTADTTSPGQTPTVGGIIVDGNVQFIGDVAPLIVTMVDIQADFKETGAEYQCEMVMNSFGTSRLAQYGRAADGFSFEIGPTVGDSFLKLAREINRKYNKYYQCAVEQIRAQNPAKAQLLTPVRYVILWDKPYDAKKITEQDMHWTSTADMLCDRQITTHQQKLGQTIEDAIHAIMARSNEVNQEMTAGDGTGQRYEYKIHTTVKVVNNQNTPTATSASTDQTSTVSQTRVHYIYYLIRRFPIVKNTTVEQLFASPSNNVSTQTDIQARVKQQVIEFDYMYSGKNIDIIELSMKMNQGLAYFQLASISNTLKNQLDLIPRNNIIVDPSYDPTQRFSTIPPGQSANSVNDIGVQIPIFFGTQFRGFDEATNQSTTGSAAYTLNKHASLESLDMKIKIVGNYRLLNTIADRSKPSVVVPDNLTPYLQPGAISFSESSVMAGAVDTSIFPTSNDQYPGSSFGSFPLLAKVNIFMPASNDDLEFFENAGIDPNLLQYKKEFWYQGYYYILSVEHEFVDGTFTQSIEMIPLQTNVEFNEKNQASGSALTNKINSICFDTPPDTPNNNSKQLPHPAPSSAAVTNSTTPPMASATVQDSKAVMTTGFGFPNFGPSDVIGWNEASQDIKDAITQASAQTGVNVGVMALFAAIESNFNPRATPGTSSALGLYQFIDDTWYGVVNKTVPAQLGSYAIPISGLTAQQILDLRTNPVYCSIGGGCFLASNGRLIGSNNPGDLYLAHFLGPIAKTIIQYDKSGGGNTLMSTVYSEYNRSWDKITKANPSLIKDNVQTVHDIRLWAHRQCLKRLVKAFRALPTVSSPFIPAAPITQAAPQTGNDRIAKVQVDKTGIATLEAKQPGKCGQSAPEAKRSDPTTDVAQVDFSKALDNSIPL